MNLASSSRLSAAAALPTDRPIRNACRRSAVDLVSIPDQVARSFIPRECLRDLACNPFRGRMRCSINPDKVSAGQPDNDEDIEQIEANGRDDEQVHGRHSVRALARSARRIPVDHPKLEKMAGDALEMVEGDCVAFCGAARSRERSNQRYTILPLRALTPSS
jgi:hypothetical protein